MSVTIDPFHAMGVSRIAHALKTEGRSVIHMEFGQPSTGAPAAALARAHEVLDNDPMGYWESPGLKARIARHYGETYDLDVAPERILLTCGASPALVTALAGGFSPGDTIAIARPGYVAYRNAIRALKLNLLEIPCGPESEYRLTAAALEALDPAPAGVIIASPANPTGAIIPADGLAALAEVCNRRGIRIISDEIYHGLTYGEPTRSMLAWAPDAVVINSFSKYFSMVAWRLGWMVAPAGAVEHYRSYVANLFLTAPSLSQHAALAAMDCKAELDGHVAAYAVNRQLMIDALPELGLTAIAPPDGAFYIYADVGHLTDDSLAFCEQMVRDTGVATAPGVDFDPVDGRRFIRISFAVSTDETRDALRRLKPWFAARAQARARA
jgi:aspartate/methionine/tyrosine aminotransferase